MNGRTADCWSKCFVACAVCSEEKKTKPCMHPDESNGPGGRRGRPEGWAVPEAFLFYSTPQGT